MRIHSPECTNTCVYYALRVRMGAARETSISCSSRILLWIWIGFRCAVCTAISQNACSRVDAHPSAFMHQLKYRKRYSPHSDIQSPRMKKHTYGDGTTTYAIVAHMYTSYITAHILSADNISTGSRQATYNMHGLPHNPHGERIHIECVQMCCTRGCTDVHTNERRTT